jgi:hypothetical protein
VNPAQFRAIRKRFFPDDPTRFLIEMGYGGNRNTLKQRARRYESGQLEIPRNVARFAWLLDQWRLQAGEVNNDLPEWPEEL